MSPDKYIKVVSVLYLILLPVAILFCKHYIPPTIGATIGKLISRRVQVLLWFWMTLIISALFVMGFKRLEISNLGWWLAISGILSSMALLSVGALINDD